MERKLLDASKAGQTTEVIGFIRQGVNCNFRNDNIEQGTLGRTAVMEACIGGHMETVLALIAAGADVNLKDKNGDTALIHAAAYGHTQITIALIAASANVNIKNNNGNSALMAAAATGRAEAAVALMRAGADVNVKDNQGWTAMNWSCFYCAPHTCAILWLREFEEFKLPCEVMLEHCSGFSSVGAWLMMTCCFPRCILSPVVRPDLTCIYICPCIFTLGVSCLCVPCMLDVRSRQNSTSIFSELPVPEVFSELNSSLEETEQELGLSQALASTYMTLLDDLEIFRDQVKVRELDARIAVAKAEMNTNLVSRLWQERQLLSTATKERNAAITVTVLSQRLESLIDECKNYYKQLTESNALDGKARERCTKTIEYVKSIPFILNDREQLAVVLRPRQTRHNDGIEFPPNVKRIEWTDISLSKKDCILGQGSFGRVIRAQWMKEGISHDVAVKVLTESFTGNKKTYELAMESALKEAAVANTLVADMMNKDAVVLVHGVAVGALPLDLTNIFRLPSGEAGIGVVMRLETGGSLFDLLYPNRVHKVRAKLPLREKLHILLGLISGLQELHGLGYVHGDIKPQNVLLSDSTNPKVRLSDIGLTELRTKIATCSTTSCSTSSIATETEELALSVALLTTDMAKVTRIYCAPEMLTNPSDQGGPGTRAEPSRKTDIYAFALLCWEIFAEEKPYNDASINEIMLARMVHSDTRPDMSKLPASTPDQINNMIRSSWDKDRSKRPSATEWWSTLDFCHNIELKKTFDIYISHAWTQKPLISQVHFFLSQKGFRVWYDLNELGYDLKKSVRFGIQSSTVVLACVSKIYEECPSCMFELKEIRRLFPDKPVVGLLSERMMGGAWRPGDDFKALLRTTDNTFCDISDGATPPGPANDPRWADPDNDPPENLIEALSKSLDPLMKILVGTGCAPSYLC